MNMISMRIKKCLLAVLLVIFLFLLPDSIFREYIPIFIKYLIALASSFAFIRDFSPKSEFLSDVITLEAVLIGVAIPVSLQVVNWTADKYRDHEIAKFFVDERIYKLQFFLLLTNIVIVVFFRFIDVTNHLLLWFAFAWLIVNVILFYKFIKVVEQYAANTDRYLLGRLKKHVENILQK